MPTTHRLDILILYNGHTACSAGSVQSETNLPFPKKSLNNPCNAAYSYFLDYAGRLGLSAGLSSSSDIIGSGLCSSYWIYKNQKWQKIRNHCQSDVIFDKFSPTQTRDIAQQKLFFSKSSVKMYNTENVTNTFFDKANTYQNLLAHAIPTLAINTSSKLEISSACATITNLTNTLTNQGDFNSDFILKDRFGAGGWHVYKIDSKNPFTQIQKIMKKNPKTSFILQPFALFDRGFVYDNAAVPTDIRLIYLGGQLFHSYLRFPKSGDFRCNEHQGGSSVYIKESEIPPNIRLKADLIADSLKSKALVALDFIVTNSGNPYLIEGNTGPGLSWDQSNKKEVFKGKKLIRGIVDQLAVTRTKQKVDICVSIVKIDRYPETLKSSISVSSTALI